MGGPFGGRFPAMFRGGARDYSGSAGGGAFPTMNNPGAQPQPTPGNPMTGNTTAAPGSPNPSNPMMGNFGMLGPMLGMGGMGGFMGGGANLANMNPTLAMALQGKFNQGG